MANNNIDNRNDLYIIALIRYNLSGVGGYLAAAKPAPLQKKVGL